MCFSMIPSANAQENKPEVMPFQFLIPSAVSRSWHRGRLPPVHVTGTSTDIRKSATIRYWPRERRGKNGQRSRPAEVPQSFGGGPVHVQTRKLQAHVHASNRMYYATKGPSSSLTKVDSSVLDDAEPARRRLPISYIFTGGTGRNDPRRKKIAKPTRTSRIKDGVIPGEYRGQPVVGWGQTYKSGKPAIGLADSRLTRRTSPSRIPARLQPTSSLKINALAVIIPGASFARLKCKARGTTRRAALSAARLDSTPFLAGLRPRSASILGLKVFSSCLCKARILDLDRLALLAFVEL